MNDEERKKFKWNRKLAEGEKPKIEKMKDES